MDKDASSPEKRRVSEGAWSVICFSKRRSRAFGPPLSSEGRVSRMPANASTWKYWPSAAKQDAKRRRWQYHQATIDGKSLELDGKAEAFFMREGGPDARPFLLRLSVTFEFLHCKHVSTVVRGKKVTVSVQASHPTISTREP
jgi:hypothetical protein